MHVAVQILTCLTFYVVASVALTDGDRPIIPRPVCTSTQAPLQTYKCSCKQILSQNSNTPSGVNYIVTASGTVIQVYCEMGLNGGGYTFLSPASLALITDADVQALFTDTSTFLMRIRKTDGTQPFGVLKQLPQYSATPLKVGLNQNTGYNSPINSPPAYLGNNFLYFGFLPQTLATNHNTQGLQINGVADTFTNCDNNPNSHITLFPNFAERKPSTYDVPGAFCDVIASNMLPNPSRRVMPPEYFMFHETHWGGCGCYQQSNSPSSKFISAAIGFK